VRTGFQFPICRTRLADCADQELPEQTALAYRRHRGEDELRRRRAHLEAIRYCRTAGEKAGELSADGLAAYSALAREGRFQTADVVLRDRKAHPVYQAIAAWRAQLAVFVGITQAFRLLIGI
jgi:hypothetical protein